MESGFFSRFCWSSFPQLLLRVMLSRHAAAPHARPNEMPVEQCISPSPGTPGEGRGEGFFLVHGRALTLTLSRSTGRGNQRIFRAGGLPTKHLAADSG